MVELLTIEMFADRLNDVFAVTIDRSTVIEMELIEVKDLRERFGGGAGLPRTPFSIIFRGPGDQVCEQRTYRFEHADLGVQEIFIVPIGPGPGGMRYEAVFS